MQNNKLTKKIKHRYFSIFSDILSVISSISTLNPIVLEHTNKTKIMDRSLNIKVFLDVFFFIQACFTETDQFSGRNLLVNV